MKQYPTIFIKSHPRGGKGLKNSKLELHFSSTSSNGAKTREDILDAIGMMIRLLEEKCMHIARRDNFSEI
jgi:hypothetical protein